MTNRNRILALIRDSPGLTDSEIRQRTGIEPHQQVNQIGRSLAADGLSKRVLGPDGLIINVPAPGARETDPIPPAFGQSMRTSSRGGQESLHPPTTTPFRELRFVDSMIVVPCSGAKSRGNATPKSKSVVEALPRDLARELSDRRRLNAVSANVDESTLLPAAERYDGTFYTAGRSAIRNLADQGARVLMISGGYGLVLANESIGMYEQVFRPAMWPTRLIERCLGGFAEVNGVRQVIGVLSATTGYSTVFRRTRWPRQVDEVVLASPESTTGAMVKAPRAQGQWLAAFASSGRIPTSWSSSDGLHMEITQP